MSCQIFMFHNSFCPHDAMLARVLAVVVCLSVCLSVTLQCCVKMAKCKIRQTTPHDITEAVVFWRQPSLVGDLHSPWNLCSKWPTPFRKQRFWPISVYSALTVRASEKSSISTTRKSTTRFPASHRWTVYVTPKSPKGWHKTRFCWFCQ